MENFIVSARKYRPATFDMVVGQASITNTLKNAIKNNHLAQAFLFCGPRGVGKTTCARIMAKTINCENLTENIEACNQCKSCVSFNESNSFNVHELDAASNNSVDDIRNLVDQVRIPPHIGKYKVYVIDEVHMLSQAAFNAFLKTLEEPPAYAKFILATTEKHKIIPTILSRCQIFDFNRITIDDIARQLEFVAKSEKIETEYDALHIIAQKADGAMRDALSIFDQIVSFAGNHVTYKAVVENLNVLDYDYFFAMTDHILAAETTDILLLYNTIIDKGFEGAHFIGGFSSHLRNLLMCKDAKTVKLMDVGENIRQKYLEQAGKCHPVFLLKALEMSNKCDFSYRTSNNKRLHVELTLLQIAALLQSGQESTPAASAPALKAPAQALQTPAQSRPQSNVASPSTSYQSEKKEQPSATQTTQPSSGSAPSPAASRPAPSAGPGPKSFSIKINQSPQEDEKKKDQLTSNLEQEDKPEESFSENDLLDVWDKLKENYKISSVSIFTALNTHPPVLIDDITIEMGVDNLVQQDNIFEQKPQILSFLRKNLNNYAINFQVRIKENRKVQKAYLPAEKFQKMVDKNPDLERLKNDLDLDLIY
ncbi:MAG: DNA polymerase III subunit gamma/tau [Bacteroidetes bacterium]|nr:MAG: DNA polymerase III subunit gamma/tau [Bacteroidota bacterium]